VRLGVAASLAIAVALGAWLRFAGLGAREMSADEGASWAAAAAPSLSAAVRTQAILNPGKLALYEVALHGWMGLFGDGIAAMRSLSAALDTLSIVAVFALTRELLAGLDDADAAAALAALLFAVNLVSIKYARELRMYPLALLIVLLQVRTFIRAARYGRRLDLALLVLLTALAAAAHFSAGFVVAAEMAWLLLILPRISAGSSLLAAAAALAGGAALFFVVALPSLRTGASAFAHGATAWIERPRWWAPVALFNKGIGTFAFPLLAVLAAWGAWRARRRAREAVSFALAWMWLPPVMMLAASYVFAPMFVERYALWCFVPFFILAAIGAWETPGAPLRATAVAAALLFALGHLHAYRRRAHDVQWREAARAAAGALAPGAKVAVAPPFAVNVVRYYLRADRAAETAMPAEGSASEAELLIAGQGWNVRGEAAKLAARYPRLLCAFRGVRVYGRAPLAR